MSGEIRALPARGEAETLEYELTTAPPTRVRLRWSAVTEGAERRDVAWALLREMLAPGAELSNPCARCGGPHGPVRTTDAAARPAIAYAGPIALAAVADAGPGSFAIDAEPETDPVRDAAGLDGVLGARTDVQLRDWIRVEAALKADGRGLQVDPGGVTVDAKADGRWRATVPGGSPVSGWDLDGIPGVMVSVAISAEAQEVLVHPATL